MHQNFLKQQGLVVKPSNVFRYICTTTKHQVAKRCDRWNFFKSSAYLVEEQNNKDKLKGVLKEGLSTEQTATEWFQRDLAFGSSANKFHLPSLGTMAIATMGVKASGRKEIALIATRIS